VKASRVRYGVVGLALSLAVFSYIQRVAIAQAAGPIANDLHLDKAQLGAVLGAFGLAYAAFEMPMGLLGDKIGVRRVLTQIVLAWSLFTALTGAAWSFVSLWIIRFLFGAGEAGCFPNLTRMLGQWLPRTERIRAQAMMWASTRWGGAVAAPLALIGINLFGWRWSFVAFAMLGVVWCVAFLVWFRENPADHPRLNDAERALLIEPAAMVSEESEGWLRILLRWQTMLLLFQYFCWSYVWYFFITWLPLYLEEEHGQSAAWTAGLSTLPLIAGGFGTLVSGWIPVRVPRRAIAVACFAAVTTLLLILPHLAHVGLVVATMAAISFFGDVTVPISWNTCVETGRRYTATISSAMNMFGNFAGFAAPWITGIILQNSGNDWNPVLYLMTGIAAIGTILWLFIDTEPQAAAPPQPAPAAI
jgi:sugar phosphate permease